LSAKTGDVGIPTVVNNIAFENLVRLAPDGRPTPWVADRWQLTPSKAVRIHMRPTRFHDGTPLTAAVLAQIVQKSLPRSLDIGAVIPVSDSEIEISQQKASSFILESLDVVTLKKPGAPDIGTGPFVVTSRGEVVEMRANEQYAEGRPKIDRIVVRDYQTVRGAWADMLRGEIDMLYQVGQDALQSLQPSSSVSIFWFQRPYAYIVLFNARRPALKSPEVRRALNLAVNRAQLIHEALDDHATAGAAVSPHHWAYKASIPMFPYDPAAASKVLGRRLHMTCIIQDGPVFERLAITVRKQLEAVGVDVSLEALPLAELIARVTERHDFDAVLFDAQIGPTMFRAYDWWHSGGTHNYGGFSSPRVDAALDAVRDAKTDGEYAAGLAMFQEATLADPPALFLAWGERARAVSRRFEVPVEAGRDVLTTLRLWRPRAGTTENRN